MSDNTSGTPAGRPVAGAKLLSKLSRRVIVMPVTSRSEDIPKPPLSFKLFSLVPRELGLRVERLFAEAAKSKDSMEALTLYQQILALNPRHDATQVNVGTIFYVAGALDKAEKHYRMAIEANPCHAMAYYNLGNTLERCPEKVMEAIAAYEKAIALNPRFEDAHYNLALLYEGRHIPRKALKHWTMYIRLDANTPWTQYARQRIKVLLEKETLQLVRGDAA